MIGELMALGTAILWTLSAVLYKTALQTTKPFSANIIRCLLTSATLIATLTIIGKAGVLASLPLSAVALASVSGIIGLGLGDTLYMTSLKLLGVARAVPITCVYPLFTMLLATFLYGESITPQVAFGAVAIALGIGLLSQEEETSVSETGEKISLVGVAYAFGTAVVWAASILMIDVAVNLPETGSFDDALAINAIRITATALILVASAPITDNKYDFLKIGKEKVAVLTLGGVAALAIGWFLLTLSFTYIPESHAVPLSSTTPLFASVSGIIVLNEPVTIKNVVGSTIIVLAILLIFAI